MAIIAVIFSWFLFGLALSDDDIHSECKATTFSNNADFKRCLAAAVEDSASELPALPFFPTKQSFNASIEALFSLTFKVPALNVSLCNCNFSFTASSTLAVPDPHDNGPVSAAYLRIQPSVNFIYGVNASVNGKYTFIMVDLDDSLPNGSNGKPGLHWLVYDFDGTDFTSGRTGLGFRRPLPYMATHKYLFLLYKQNSSFGQLDLNQYVSGCSHCQFDIQNFTSVNNLALSGTNWQPGKYDNSVAKYHVDNNNPVKFDCDKYLKTCSGAASVKAFVSAIFVLMALHLLSAFV
eukprot:m.272458 g.272458  ORF g.272458 m.272458 type:complete len:292 (+) comp40563_c0_seq2:4163-5038(+)